eukprot:3065040-Pyramimonas_sp.AAC.1
MFVPTKTNGPGGTSRRRSCAAGRSQGQSPPTIMELSFVLLGQARQLVRPVVEGGNVRVGVADVLAQ